jgi:hypothetical protein
MGLEFIRKNAEAATKTLKALLQKNKWNEKNQKDQAEINWETENGIRPEKTKKRSSALFLGLIYFSSFIILLILGARVILGYFFPAEEVRVLVKKEDTKQLNLSLSIKKIKFSLLSRVRIDGVTLGPAVQPIANAEDGCG